MIQLVKSATEEPIILLMFIVIAPWLITLSEWRQMFLIRAASETLTKAKLMETNPFMLEPKSDSKLSSETTTIKLIPISIPSTLIW